MDLSAVHVLLLFGVEVVGAEIKVDIGVFPELLQIGQHSVGGGVTVVRVGGHGLHGDGLQRLGNGGIDLPGGERNGIDMLDGHRNRGIPLKGQAAGNHLIEDHTGRVQIGALVNVAAPGLLRRNVVYRSQSLLGEGAVPSGGHPGNAEVGHLHAAVPEHHDVMGFDVPVDDAAAVGVPQGLDDLGDEVQGLPPVELVPLLLHVLLQGDAVDELHDDVLDIGGAADVVHSHNVGVRQHGNSLRLIVETAAQLCVLGQIVPQDLQGHQTVEPMAAGLIDPGHTAHADELQDFISIVE